MRRIGSCLALAAAALVAATAAAAAPPVVVGCDEIAQVPGPVVPNRRTYRVVVGAAALPRPTVRYELVDGAGGPRRYWTKMGLLVRLGAGPVDVYVPPAWRRRVRVHWGYPNLHGPAPSLRVERCPLPPSGEPYSKWLAYPGGVYVSAPACVPLVLRVGAETARVRLSLGRRCR